MLSSQSYGFSSGHVCNWELDYKENWVPKNWCFWTVVLERTLERPLDCKEFQPVHPKEICPEYSLEGLMLNLKLQYFGHLMQTDTLEKTLMLGKTEGRRKRGQQRMRCLDGITNSMDMSLSKLRVGDGQGGLACCNPGGHKELDTTERLNSTECCTSLKFYHQCTQILVAIYFQQIFCPLIHFGDLSNILLWFFYISLVIGEGYGNPLQCSCLENPRDGEAWWAAPYGVAQSWTGLKRLSSSSSSNWWSWTPFHIFICYLNILCFEMLLQIFYLFFHYVVFFMLIYGEYICVYILSPFREREIKYLFFFF